jgi:hypothetical protein
MSTTPDPTRNIGDSCCSKCGKLLLVNDSAIVYTDMRNDMPLVLGNCCADLVIGSLIQDFAENIRNEIAMGYWINHRHPARMRRIAHTAKQIVHEYELALDFGSQRIGEEKDK